MGKLIPLTLCTCFLSSSILAQDEPLVLSFLQQTQGSFEATGYVGLGDSGFLFLALTGERIYLPHDDDKILKLYDDKTLMRIAAHTSDDEHGCMYAESYVLTHIK
jgi:hypothetical protein